MIRSLIIVALTTAVAAQAAEAPPRVLTLDEALQTALVRHPQVRQARANTTVAEARADQAAAPLLPQVSGNAGYQRSTANFASRPGSTPSGYAQAQSSTSWSTFNYYNLGLSASQLVYDFGQSTGRWSAAKATAEAQALTEKATFFQLSLALRAAYFQARAAKALVAVATETLENQERHLAQAQGFVEIGTRPEIDLAQSRSNRASARVQLINAENTYETAKVRLNQAMGVEGPIDYDVGDERFPSVTDEEKSIDDLLEEAIANRPELAALAAGLRAQELTLSSARGGYWPSLSLSTALTDAGAAPDKLAWNWNAGAALTWPLFQGGATLAATAEAHAALESLRAQVDTERQQVRVDLDQARLAVKAAQASLAATEEAIVYSRESLRLAESRYETGVGSVIELSDAQLAVTNVEAQKVQAELNLATARAQLLQALGRP